MGYCAVKIRKSDVKKVKQLFASQRFYKLVDSMENYDYDRSCIWFERSDLWMHNSDEEKVLKYLDKKKFHFS